MSTRPVINMYDDQQYLNRRHKVITRQDLDGWLFRIGKSNAIVDPDNIYNNYLRTVTRAEIESGVYALHYDRNNNDEGLSISGYSIGDGKSQYASNQNVIVQDVQFVLSDEPQIDDYVFEVHVKDDPDNTNAGYVDDILDDQVTFEVVCSDQGTITVTKSDQTTQLVTPQTVTFVRQNDQNLYVYEFNVKRNDTLKQNTGDYPNWFSVSHSEYNKSLPIVVWVVGDMSTDIYTNMKYYYTIGDSESATNNYEDVASVNYSFKIPSSNINTSSVVTFNRTATGNRVSNRATPPGGYGEYDKVLKDYTFSAPFTFNLNVGKRNFTPSSVVTIDQILRDSTILFTNSVTPSGDSSYQVPYTNNFTCTPGVHLDTSYGSNGVNYSDGQLYARVASDSTTGTITANVRALNITKGNDEWSEHYGFVDDPNMQLAVSTLPKTHIKFKYQGDDFNDASVIAYKLDSGNMTLFVELKEPGTGYTRYAFNIGDTVTGTINEQQTTFNVKRKTYDAYDQHGIYIIIPNYDSNSTYEINIPGGMESSYKTMGAHQTWCPLTYQFGSGVKCSNLETITTRLWKDADLYGNTSEIRLCEIRVRDGVVPKCDDKSYISFRKIQSSDQYIHYIAYVSGAYSKTALINDLNHDNPIIIRISGKSDPSAKEYSWIGDDFPPILIDNTPEEE